MSAFERLVDDIADAIHDEGHDLVVEGQPIYNDGLRRCARHVARMLTDGYDWDTLIDQYDRRLDDHAEDPFTVEEEPDDGR